jgi:hypothetical protein
MLVGIVAIFTLLARRRARAGSPAGPDLDGQGETS